VRHIDRFAFVIDDAKELLRLLVRRKKMFDYPEVRVLLNRNSPRVRYVIYTPLSTQPIRRIATHHHFEKILARN
jgi:hypothetical protein